jgi:hypothetical protein
VLKFPGDKTQNPVTYEPHPAMVAGRSFSYLFSHQKRSGSLCSALKHKYTLAACDSGKQKRAIVLIFV